MQRLEVSGAVRLIYRSLGVKGLRRHFSYNVMTQRCGPLWDQNKLFTNSEFRLVLCLSRYFQSEGTSAANSFVVKNPECLVRLHKLKINITTVVLITGGVGWYAWR